MASNVAPTKGLVRMGSTLPGLGGAETGGIATGAGDSSGAGQGNN